MRKSVCALPRSQLDRSLVSPQRRSEIWRSEKKQESITLLFPNTPSPFWFFFLGLPHLHLSASPLHTHTHTLSLPHSLYMQACLSASPRPLSFRFSLPRSLRGAVYLGAIENDYQTLRSETWFRDSLSGSAALAECRAALPLWPTKWNYVFLSIQVGTQPDESRKVKNDLDCEWRAPL